MKLYFGSTVSALTTVMTVIMLAFIARSIACRGEIECWGRRCLALLVWGLVVCCLAAARDGLDKTIQNAVDGSCAPGLFPLVSVQNIIGCVGALAIVVSAIAAPIVKTQQAREAWFFVMSGGAVLKVLTVEISRIIH